MSWVTLLAYVQSILHTYEACCAYFKQWIRVRIGPPPDDLLVFSDNRIFPCSTTYPNDLTPHTYSEKHHTLGEECRKRLPWVSMVYTHGEITHDFSEWCSTIRCSHSVSLLALVRLAAAAHNVYIAEDAVAEVHTMNRRGEEEVFVFQGCTHLVKKPMIVHSHTMSYDVVEDGPLFF